MQRATFISGYNMCPICGQSQFSIAQAGSWSRGVEVVCALCRRDRIAEARAWIDGWDSAVKHAKGQ